MAVEKTLDFCVDKVLAEEEDGYLVGATDGSDIDLVADSLTANTMVVENDGSMDGGAVDVEPTAFSLDGGVFMEGVCYGGTPAVAVVVADTMESPVAAIPELELLGVVGLHLHRLAPGQGCSCVGMAPPFLMHWWPLQGSRRW
nr:unnamed protein product [Digitaria exilis]